MADRVSAPPSPSPLARAASPPGIRSVLLPAPTGRGGVREMMGARLTAWNPQTFANTVIMGGQTYNDLPVINPTALDIGPVVLTRTPAGLAILGVINRLGGAQPDLLRLRSLRSDVSVFNSTALVNAGDLNFPVQTFTTYALDGMIMSTAPSQSDARMAFTGPPNMIFRWGPFGQLVGAAASGIDSTVVDGYGTGITEGINGQGVLTQAHVHGYLDVGDTPGILQMMWAQDTASTVGAAVLRAGSWLRLSELGGGKGGKVVTKTYPITNSRSFRGDGTNLGDGNNVHLGDYDPTRPYGNERAQLGFDGAAIRSDLTNASVRTARVWLYCYEAENSTGSFVGIDAGTAFTSTYDPAFDSAASISYSVVKNAWNYFDINYGTAAFLPKILTGSNIMGLPPTPFGGYATGYRGYGFSAALRPYIEITYVVPN